MKAFIAPIQLDALVLPHGKVVQEALADYSKMPYTDGRQDFNSGVPFVGEAIVNQPFQDDNLFLPAGTHLHWSLPPGYTRNVAFRALEKAELDGLRIHFSSSKLANWASIRDQIWNQLLLAPGWLKVIQGDLASILDREHVDQALFNTNLQAFSTEMAWPRLIRDRFVQGLMQLIQKDLGNEFPLVPDVWLVVRKSNGSVLRTWLVESGYLASSRAVSLGNLNAVNVPFHDCEHENKSQPFRYLGRVLIEPGNWASTAITGNNYLQKLTAMGFNPEQGSKGFAEPSFSAFYPNCRSVFGCYDPENLSANPQTSYEVLGLYTQGNRDYFMQFLRDFDNRHAGSSSYFEDLNTALADDFLWKAAAGSEISDANSLPKMTCLYGKALPRLEQAVDSRHVEFSMGNNGMEALSAYLASKSTGDKSQVEDLLEAIQMGSKLQGRALDLGHVFREARHEAGFTGVAAGSIWVMKLETTAAQSATETNDDHAGEISLPDELALLLNEANILQQRYDAAWEEVNHWRRQLFGDWHKYMLGSYPPVGNLDHLFDADQMMEYIRQGSAQQVQELLDATGKLLMGTDEDGRLKTTDFTGLDLSISERLSTKLNALLQAMNAYSQQPGQDGKTLMEQGKQLALRLIAAPRYWVPNDPVVMFAEQPEGSELPLLSNNRNATPITQEPYECKVLDLPIDMGKGFAISEFAVALRIVGENHTHLAETGSPNPQGIWNPFLMEWEVEFLPVFPKSNEATDDRKYDPDYVTAHYGLDEKASDLSFNSDPNFFQNGNLYTGRSFLNPYPAVRLDLSIGDFIQSYGESQSVETLALLNQAKSSLQQTNVLAQSLGGLGDAMQQWALIRQLDVAEPIGFPLHQQFTEEVANLVGDQNLMSPLPLNDFNPIRSGRLRILRLRLVDSFGQSVDFVEPVAVPSENLKAPGVEGIHLPPRLTQPARLNFRVLSSMEGVEEMNSHPASSPICGWLVPNHLDRSIMFFAQSGDAIGSLTLNAANPWLPAPDADASLVTHIESMVDPHLRKVAQYLFDRQMESIRLLGTADDSFLHHFLNALDSAQDHIDPENFAEHLDLSLLMGKPIAVVRAKLNLELLHPANQDQGWTRFDHELQGHGRSDDDFPSVKFPIRIGEYQQVNDGLLGYWLEDENGQLGSSYFSSEANPNAHPDIVTYAEGAAPINIERSINDPETKLTMLVNPLGEIHVVSGILPVKVLKIPRDQYQPALKRMAMSFLAAPLLSPENHLQLSLPTEDGFEWAWHQKDENRQWERIAQTVLIKRDQFSASFRDEPSLWNQLLKKGWLKVVKDEPETAIITEQLHRAYPPDPSTDPNPFPTALGKRIDAFFDKYGRHIETFDRQANLGTAQVLREGWLSLSPLPDTKAEA